MSTTRLRNLTSKRLLENYEKDSIKVVLDFAQTFHRADEFTANENELYAWYD